MQAQRCAHTYTPAHRTPQKGTKLKVVGGWRLLATIGWGTFGEVKYARDEHGAEAAIKIWRKVNVGGTKYKLMHREIAVMKALDHPHVLKLYDVLETQKNYCLVLELAGGGQLFSRIEENKRFTDPTARRYFQQLISAVKYCHDQGIVHRDLKPQNLLLTYDDKLKLADFGFANVQTAENTTGHVTARHRLKTQCGTPYYAAPEIFKGEGYDGFCTDVWSCGVILYHMLTGYVPFRSVAGDSEGVPQLQGVIGSILHGVYTIPREVSADAATLIEGVLRKDPAERFTIKQIMHNQWFLATFAERKLSAAPPMIVINAGLVDSAVHAVDEGEVSPPTSPLSHTSCPCEESCSSDVVISASDVCEALPLPSSTFPVGVRSLSATVGSDGGDSVRGVPHLDSCCSTPPGLNRAASVHTPGSLHSPTAGLPGRASSTTTNTSCSNSLTLLARPNVRAHSAPSPPSPAAPHGDVATRSPTPPPHLSPMRRFFGGRKEKPAPEPTAEHCFARRRWKTPHFCFVCKKVIFGIGRQGFECITCRMPVHTRCVDKAVSMRCADFLAAGSPRRRPSGSHSALTSPPPTP